MPKMIVVFAGDEFAMSAEAVAAGGNTVRFMEVEVRAAAATTSKHRAVDPHTLGSYDGIVFVGDDGPALAKILAAACGHAHDDLGENHVIGVHPTTPERLMAVAQTGAIVIASVDGAHAATALGARVAKVAGWVRHGLGHEADGQTHTHGHQHAHDHHRHPSPDVS